MASQNKSCSCARHHYEFIPSNYSLSLARGERTRKPSNSLFNIQVSHAQQLLHILMTSKYLSRHYQMSILKVNIARTAVRAEDM